VFIWTFIDFTTTDVSALQTKVGIVGSARVGPLLSDDDTSQKPLTFHNASNETLHFNLGVVAFNGILSILNQKSTHTNKRSYHGTEQ
jgi:hypothetical protein